MKLSKLIVTRVKKTSVLLLAIGFLSFAPIGFFDNTPQTLPFSQNWTNTGLITANDNWTAVPGIIGYRGDALSASPGTNPQTIVADGSATPVNVIANQSNPNTNSTGGIAEFDGIANPTIALQGSGTADAPHIVIHLNTTGASNINVAYNLRDIDGAVDNAVQPVALQYRVGAAGNFTDIPAGFVADASSGPSLATLVTPVSVMLPAACNNQPVVHIRIITSDAVGSDEWIGIDDINITAPPAPIITSNLADQLTNDINGNLVANPGETITYKNTITNSGTAPANSVVVTPANNPPAGTTNTGNVVTSALARDDNFSTFFNTPLNTGNVISNDFGLPSVTVVSFGTTASGGTTTLAGNAGTTDGGGTLTVNSNGTFSYTPLPGFSGNDQFKYIATTGVAGLPNDVGTVVIAVATDITFSTTLVNPPCNGASTGSITFTGVSGGSGAGYTYSITGSAGTYFASPSFIGLPAGVYPLAVKDGAGYIKTGTATLNNPPLITFTHLDVNNVCNGAANGSITFIASGGTGTLTYSITGAGGTYFASPSFTGLTGSVGGTIYPLAVKDANGCIVTGTATLTDPAPITFTFTKTNITCFALNNGTIVFNAPSGGTPPYTYSINGVGGPFQTTPNHISFTGLPAATYTLVVKDAAGCNSAPQTTIVVEPAFLMVNGTTPVNLIYNTAMSTVTYTTTGGTGTITWSSSGLPTNLSLNTTNGQLTGTPNVTGVFNATITATDANGCVFNKAVTINVAPQLVNNAYNAVGNTQLVADGHSVPATPFTTSAINILTNDLSDAAITATVVTNAATTQGGSISIDVAGKFIYSPPVGFTGTDTYVYTASSNGVAATATITFTVANMVWFVNNTYAGANGASDGRSHRPYTDVASAEAASAINQIIYVHTGAGNTTGNALLKSGQTLRGAGSALNVGALSIAAGTKPTLTGMITLANTVTVDGFDMSTGATTAIISSGATSVTVGVGNITTTGAVNAVTLTNTTGSVTIAGGTLTGGAGAVFNVSGGTATISCAAAINQATAAQRLINIQSITGGSVNLSGNLSSTGTSNGINVSSCTGGTITFSGGTKTLNTPGVTPVTLATNTGATINFSGGGLAITSTTATGFNATGGGIITSQGTGNTITSTTGIALNVANTTIGASNLNFQSISASGAPNGMILNNTGSSGGLVVTGTGSAGTGGTIQNSVTHGVVMTSTLSPTLSFMNINDNAGLATDDGMQLTNITGTVTFTGLSVSGSPHNGITFDNFNTNLTAFIMTNSTIACPAGFPCQPSGTTGNDGILLVMRGTSILTSGLISGSTFSGVRAVAVQIQTNDAARIGSASGGLITAPVLSNSFTIQNNTFTGNGIGIDMGISQVSSMAFQILNNTIVGKLTIPNAIPNTASSHAINAFTAAGADTGPASHFFVGKIDGNTIGTPGVKDSGSGIGSGIRVVVQGQNTQGSVTVSNNLIREVPNSSILTFYGQNGNATAGTNTARFKIINNTMPAPSGSNLALCGPANTPCAEFGIFILADEGTPVCNIITGNNIYDLTTVFGGAADIYLAERAGPPVGAQLTVEGTGGSNSAYIIANNTLAGATKFIDENANTSQVALNSCGAFPARPALEDSDGTFELKKEKIPMATSIKKSQNVIPIKSEGEKWVSSTPEKVNK